MTFPDWRGGAGFGHHDGLRGGGTLDALAHRAPATNDLLILADWLATNGAVHLSAIERIELAERLITRRRFLIGAGALGLGVITSCGNVSPASTATSGGPRTVQWINGTEEILVSPRRAASQFFPTLVGLAVLGMSGGAVAQESLSQIADLSTDVASPGGVS